MTSFQNLIRGKRESLECSDLAQEMSCPQRFLVPQENDILLSLNWSSRKVTHEVLSTKIQLRSEGWNQKSNWTEKILLGISESPLKLLRANECTSTLRHGRKSRWTLCRTLWTCREVKMSWWQIVHEMYLIRTLAQYRDHVHEENIGSSSFTLRPQFVTLNLIPSSLLTLGLYEQA